MISGVPVATKSDGAAYGDHGDNRTRDRRQRAGVVGEKERVEQFESPGLIKSVAVGKVYGCRE